MASLRTGFLLSSCLPRPRRPSLHLAGLIHLVFLASSPSQSYRGRKRGSVMLLIVCSSVNRRTIYSRLEHFLD